MVVGEAGAIISDTVAVTAATGNKAAHPRNPPPPAAAVVAAAAAALALAPKEASSSVASTGREADAPIVFDTEPERLRNAAARGTAVTVVDNIAS